MKIIRIIARLNVGGPAKHVVWLTAGLRSDCETILVAGTVPPGEEDMGYFAADQGVLPLFVPQMSREISPKDALTVWKLFRLFLRERPDVVHTHTAKAGTVGRVAGFLYRWTTPSALLGKPRSCRLIHTYHGHIFHGYYGRFKTGLFLSIERLLARVATDRIVVISAQQQREIHETFRVGRVDQFVVVPLGLDLADFAGWQARGSAFREKLRIGPEELLVGIVGRLTEIKNHELFLRSVAALKERGDQKHRSRFVIIGDGGMRAALEEHVRVLGLAEDVIFAGNRKDPENFYPALDVVALTSRNEGTPLTLIEAMANRRAVIATAVGGVVDLLGDPVARKQDLPYVVCRRGISVPPGNVSAFAAGLERLLEDGRLRQEVAQNGLEYVEQMHSKERLLEDIRLLYRRVREDAADGIDGSGREQAIHENRLTNTKVF